MNQESFSTTSSEEGGEMQEKETRPALEQVKNWPSGLELSNAQLFRIAAETKERLSVSVPPVETSEGWEIHFPDGTKEILAKKGEEPPPKFVYIVYNPDGKYSYATGSVGVDVNYVRRQ